jgi:hypothetical protein
LQFSAGQQILSKRAASLILRREVAKLANARGSNYLHRKSSLEGPKIPWAAPVSIASDLFGSDDRIDIAALGASQSLQLA